MGCKNSTSTKVEPFHQTRENGVIPTAHQNGHIPSSKIVDTPRETLDQLPNQKDSYVNNAGKDTRILENQTEQTQNDAEHTEEEPDETTVQPISINQDTVTSGEHPNETGTKNENQSETGTPRDQTARSSGDQSQRSTSREPVVVPTMSMAEEDLLRTNYTIKDISIHNQSKGLIDIFPHRKNVYSTAKFKDAMKNVVIQKYEKFKEEEKKVDDYDYNSDFYETWKRSPIFLVLFKYTKMYLRFSDIKTVLPSCKVANVLDNDDFFMDIITDSTLILDDLKGDSKITECKKEYRDLLQRFLDICNKLTTGDDSFNDSLEPNGRTDGRVSNMKGQDPNTIEFPIADIIQADLTVLRKWIEKWEPFDTEVPSEGAWPILPDKVVNALTDLIELQDFCRVSSDGLPGFDFTIDGEVAWPVIELDIVKNDKSTEEQEKVWRSREYRTDLNDPTFLLSRQTRLEMYFINKYEWDSSKLDPYRGFTTRLQRGWKEFQALAETEEFTVIPEDEY
ncbi:uncharacterized protein LOC134709960 [Mytilus trossulus]|uniref:uncharacterized protein LOC134709960 n=1 Tax=Mytilus trossulus TaxID=6551 RepID=UPI0030061A1B